MVKWRNRLVVILGFVLVYLMSSGDVFANMVPIEGSGGSYWGFLLLALLSNILFGYLINAGVELLIVWVILRKNIASIRKLMFRVFLINLITWLPLTVVWYFAGLSLFLLSEYIALPVLIVSEVVVIVIEKKLVERWLTVGNGVVKKKLSNRQVWVSVIAANGITVMLGLLPIVVGVVSMIMYG